jgi:hypothetical protein
MTPQEKLYNELKNGFIEKYGYEFLRLSEKDQNNLIISALQDYSNKVKNEK